MSDPNDSGRGGISPWWALLILPVAAGIGWGIGLVPTTPAPKPEPPASTQAPATPAPPGIRVDTAPSTAAQEAGPATAAIEVSGWTTYSSAVEESRRTGKPVLLDFTAEWCPPCRAMKRQVFDDPGYARRVQLAVIPVSVLDRQREEGRNSDEVESLMQRWRIEGFPTLVVFSPATGLSEMTTGYGGAEYTAGWIAQAAERVR